MLYILNFTCYFNPSLPVQLRSSPMQLIPKSTVSQSKVTVSVSVAAANVQLDRTPSLVTTVPAMPTTHFSNKPIIINRTTGATSNKLESNFCKAVHVM